MLARLANVFKGILSLFIKDLETGKLLEDTIEGVFYGLAFSPDSSTIFYTVVDETWRPHQIRAHRLGTLPADDKIIFEETDPGMWLGFDLSPDRKTLMISSGNSASAPARSPAQA